MGRGAAACKVGHFGEPSQVTPAAPSPLPIASERITPEWWLDDPEWRSGARDYWRIEVEGGERLWLFYAHGGVISGGWFCQGAFG